MALERRWAYILGHMISPDYNEGYARSHIEMLRSIRGNPIIELDRVVIFKDNGEGLIGWIAEEVLGPIDAAS